MRGLNDEIVRMDFVGFCFIQWGYIPGIPILLGKRTIRFGWKTLQARWEVEKNINFVSIFSSYAFSPNRVYNKLNLVHPYALSCLLMLVGNVSWQVRTNSCVVSVFLRLPYGHGPNGHTPHLQIQILVKKTKKLSPLFWRTPKGYGVKIVPIACAIARCPILEYHYQPFICPIQHEFPLFQFSINAKIIIP